MAVAQGTCPNCGAPIEFGVGSSIAKVCEYCRHTIVRSDRGFANLGKAADLAHTPSLIAVGDEGALSGRPFKVMGRVQLDHGKGPWDEYYVAFDYGQSWGWLAYAQGHWYATALAPGIAAPPYDSLQPELDVPLGQAVYRVAEVKSARVHSTEGELPGVIQQGQLRYYADCYGQQTAFATLDYGDNTTGTYVVFLGWVFAEPQMQVTALGPRSIQKVQTSAIRCPNCGGDVPKLMGERAERLGCPYCGAVSDIAEQRVVQTQEAARQAPDIPVGQRGTFDGTEYVCIAYMRRGTDIEGEHFSWEEFLLWSQAIGFRWLVKDPESGWSWVVPANIAEIELHSFPRQVTWGGRTFSVRNRNRAQVEYVLGEVYWKCEVGETTSVADFIDGKDVLSREEGGGEVRWSYCTPIAWPVLAQGFGLPPDGPGSRFGGHGGGAASGQSGTSTALIILIVVFFVLLICCANMCDDNSGGTVGGGVFRGGGIVSGGK